MNITCSHCQTKLTIADSKLPRDRDAAVKCPKCSEKIIVPSQPRHSEDDAGGSPSVAPPAFKGQNRALILVSDGIFLTAVREGTIPSGFSPDTASSAAQALKKMQHHVYPLVLLDRQFENKQGADPVLAGMNALDPSIRRMTCLVLMGEDLKTGDSMAALRAGVNYVIGPDGISQIAALLATALSEHQDFYRVYLESLKAAGKA